MKFNISKNHKLLRKDVKKRIKVIENELERSLLVAVSRDTSLPIKVREEAQTMLGGLPKISSPSRIKNRCILTSRSQGVDRRLKLSRIQVKNLALNGALTGIHKI